MKRRALLISSVTLAVAAAGAVACSGQVVGLGTDQEAFTAVAPSAVLPASGAQLGCGWGWAHPNVCCLAGPGDFPGLASPCAEPPSDPFLACPLSMTTYPDPNRCCSLTSPGVCSGPQGPSTFPLPCVYACPPGWFDEGGGTCCTTVGPDNAVGGCFSTASAGVDAGPLPLDDAGSPSLPATACTAACFSGWSHDTSGRCCTNWPNGVTECYSQVSGGPLPPGSVPDAGPTYFDAGTVATSCYGFGVPATTGYGPCGCSMDDGVHHYQLDCNDAINTCTCLETAAGSPVLNKPWPGFSTCGPDEKLLVFDNLWRVQCGFPTPGP